MKKLYALAASFILLSSCGGSSSVKKNDKSQQVQTITAELANMELGKKIYQGQCIACHQRNGSGIPKVYPPVVNTATIQGDKKYLINAVLNGVRGELVVDSIVYNSVMAGFPNLTDIEVAEVLNYLRNSFGAEADLISYKEVNELR